MQRNKKHPWPWAPITVATIGSAATALVLILRVVLMPLLRDGDTGRFQTNHVAIAVVVVAVIAMAYLASHIIRLRVEVPSPYAIPTAVSGIVAGVALGFSAGYNVIRWVFDGVMPNPTQVQKTPLTMLVMYGMMLFGVLGMVGLVRWGFKVAAAAGTHRGMSAWGMLAPVAWAWFRLAWYEMAYSNTIGWSEKFFDFLMVIVQVLFLFKLARFVSGIGKVCVGEMLFYAMTTALFSLSGPLTRVVLFFFGGAEAYRASELAGVADLGIGLLALALGWALALTAQGLMPKSNEEDLADDDMPYDPSLEPLLLQDDEEEELNQP